MKTVKRIIPIIEKYKLMNHLPSIPWEVAETNWRLF